VRVERSFAFIDLCGFTAFTDRHPDDRVVLVLAQLRTALRETAARRGVRVVKWLGDGAMLSTPDTEALVGLVLELDARMADALPQLPIRAGLASGPVIMFEGDDYIGRSVNLASRLCSEARPREILATDAVLGAAPCWVAATSRREVLLRGLDHPAAVNALAVRPADGSVVDAVCGLAIPTDCIHDWVGDLGFCGLGCYEAWQERRPA
jgi:adenylate cyclase